ncbi:TolC family protein [Arcobacter roscoffensis]|uniref:TolC family protein n=1 Tax=Arcobacter roscoffensis TaxID=2961520 RepID=A0ABY5E2S6_9BACT|nr:TolC family protein [Arcobacter roscoffensis]UTJ06172.1 TolC family protein [Arcobacter roscoffensis]
MHFQKSNKIKLLLCSLISVNLFANTNLDESILSDSRKKTFDLEKEQAKEDSSKLKKDWINQVIFKYTKNLGDEYKSETSSIRIDQPIFQSGGIYQAIKYANSTHDYANLQIQQERKNLIKDAYNLLFQIKKLDLNIQKTKLSLANAKIDVQRKKEQVLNGFLDSSFLDNALLTLNSSKHTLVDLKYQKQELINSFENIASGKYNNFELPKFEFISKEEYLEKNIELEKAKASIKKDKNYSHMTMARYLPSVNVYYNYSKTHYSDGKPNAEQTNDQTYGLYITMPLDSRALNDIESKRIEYLKSKLNLKNKIDDEKSFFKTKLDKLSMLEDRLKITSEDLSLYDSILEIIKEEKEAQIKTQSDYDTLKNSRDIKLLDAQVYKIDKQIILLELYSKVY